MHIQSIVFKLREGYSGKVCICFNLLGFNFVISICTSLLNYYKQTLLMWGCIVKIIIDKKKKLILINT